MAVHLDPECIADQFLLTGGTGEAQELDLHGMRLAMQPAYLVDQHGNKQIQEGHLMWKGRLLSCRSRFPTPHPPVEELVDVGTGMSVWRKGRPWFAMRYGHAYIMLLRNLAQLEGGTGREVEALVARFFGTLHTRPNDVDDLVEAHFFDVYDYVNARAALRDMGVLFRERDPVDQQLVGGLGGLRGASGTPTAVHPSDALEADDDPVAAPGPKVLSVWVQLAYVTDPSRFPAPRQDVFWTASWELPEAHFRKCTRCSHLYILQVLEHSPRVRGSLVYRQNARALTF